ncbi:MAG: GMC family oxidoreductase [Acidobacteria bacterium]|nr:GMC family oxidoreductase [Acidobacteriota bacterium]
MFERSYDIVIIGSGAGGGAVAKELAPLCRDGVKIAVLEWGAKLREDEYTGREVEMAEKLYFDMGGVLTRDRTMTLAFGRAYGGSTVVYTGTSLMIPESVIRKWAVPGLDWTDVRVRSEKYLRENNVHLLERDKLNDNNRLLYEGCKKLGYRVEQFPVNLKGCQGSGLCNLGCPNAAKQGTHRVQLPLAEELGVEVITNCRVETIGDRECIATVTTPPYGEASRWPDGRYRISAKAVVVSCGAVNSPALLLRSRLPQSLPALGRYLTTHPALILVAEHDHAITNYYGHPKSFYCDQFAESHGFLLETCMYFPFTTAKNLIGFGREHSELMQHMDRLQMILVLALDPAVPENRVTVDASGDPVVDYTLTPPVLSSLLASMRYTARIFFAGGARRVHAPAGRKFFITADEVERIDDVITMDQLKPGKVSVTSAHLMGGCRMGLNRSSSVTDAWGRVHGVPWLYVADGSLFPACSEINPYITIMALADRVAERVKTDLPALRST